MKRRSVGELIVLMVGGTVCASILIGLVSVMVIEAINPESETAQAMSFLSHILNTLLGLVAGFIAGRTDSMRDG